MPICIYLKLKLVEEWIQKTSKEVCSYHNHIRQVVAFKNSTLTTVLFGALKNMCRVSQHSIFGATPFKL